MSELSESANEPPVQSPHDLLFRYGMLHLPAARSLITSMLTSAMVGELNLDSLAYQPGSFIDPNLKERYSDVLLSVELNDKGARSSHSEALIYLLLEHKSTADRLTVLQLLAYIIRIWEQRVREGKPLCLVIPIVVYHGSRPWTYPQSIAELVDFPVVFSKFMVQFEFPVLDLASLDDEQLTGERVLQATLWLLKYGRSNQLRDKLRTILEFFLGCGEYELQTWQKTIERYVMEVNKLVTLADLEYAIENVWPKTFEPGTIAHKLSEEAREKGHQEGIEKGIEQGIEKGMQEGLRRGSLIGRIHLLQELCQISQTPVDQLLTQSPDELEILIAQLQKQLRPSN